MDKKVIKIDGKPELLTSDRYWGWGANNVYIAHYEFGEKYKQTWDVIWKNPKDKNEGVNWGKWEIWNGPSYIGGPNEFILEF